jgi:hypothetical protein
VTTRLPATAPDAARQITGAAAANAVLRLAATESLA